MEKWRRNILMRKCEWNQCYTKYVKPCRWTNSSVDQVLSHTGVVAHVVRPHLNKHGFFTLEVWALLKTIPLWHFRWSHFAHWWVRVMEWKWKLSNLDDDEVTISRLEEVVVPLHLDLHLVLHPVDLQKINKASFSDLTLFAFFVISHKMDQSLTRGLGCPLGGWHRNSTLDRKSHQLSHMKVKRKQHVHVIKWSMYIYVTKVKNINHWPDYPVLLIDCRVGPQTLCSDLEKKN